MYSLNKTSGASLCVWVAFCLIITTTNIGFSSSAFGLTGDLTNDPVKIVKKYLSLDKRGARLHALTSEVLNPYVAWTHEPAWGQVVVIDHVQIQNDIRQWEIISSVEAFIPVTFHVLGTMQWETATFLFKPHIETMRFRVRAIDNYWRIVEPMLPPHVGRKRLMDHIRSAWLAETDMEKKERLDLLWTTLKDAK